MRRLIPAVVVAVAVGVAAAPASAENSGTPPGPPRSSGHPGATIVTHCKFAQASKSVIVFNKNGVHGGGDITCAN
jgi:hypothetical protein